MSKVTTPRAAAELIGDFSCVWLVAGGGGINEPCFFLRALEERFLETGHPRGLTLCHSAGIGDKRGGGADRFAHEGMVRKVIGSHWTWSVRMQELAMDEKIDAYVMPQGTMAQLSREIAGGRPGLFTKIGLHTFVDPRLGGGAMNRRSREKLSDVVNVLGVEYLLYKAFPVDAVILRATTADEHGNLTFEHEGILNEGLSAAQAAKNSGGRVIAQVKRVVSAGSLKPMDIRVPGILVDAVVVDEGQRQSMLTLYDPGMSGECSMPREGLITPMPLNERKVIARRAAAELRKGDVVNLGFGMPAGVASVAAEEGAGDIVKLTVEQGITGGIPASGSDFGLVHNPEVILDTTSQFDWYDGGGLDMAVLSFAEADRHGNVNVSKFGERVNGIGGFINISQAAKKVVFVGAMTAGGFRCRCENGALKLLAEGSIKKLVSDVAQISFSGQYAMERKQRVLFVTERAVFELTERGMLLTEIAPGVRLKEDVLDRMGFTPLISEKLKIMDSKLFRE